MTSQTTLKMALTLVAAFVLAGCAGSDPADGQPTDTTGTDSQTTTSPSSGSRITVNQAGSSTVLPIAEAWAEEYGRDIGARIVVGGGGSGAGIAKFCRGELEIADASRAIKQSEIDTCKAAGIDPFEFQIAIDGIAVVVAKSNTFVDCLTVAQLNKMWTADESKQADSWNDLNPAWPNQKFSLFGPGADSGTYDYWKEVIIAPMDGSSASTRSDFTASEDDNVLVQGVSGSSNGLGYFGLAYYAENANELNLVKVNGGNGCVEPSSANVAAGTYTPLARPLFMYTRGKPTGVLQAYFEAAFSDDGQAIAEEVGYIKLPSDKLAAMKAKNA